MKKNKTFFMRTGLLTVLIIALTIGTTNAQTDSIYTLEKCIAYGLKNNSSIQNAEFDEYIAKAQIGEFRGIGLPQINGGASIIDNPQLPRLFQNYDPTKLGFASSFFANYPNPITPDPGSVPAGTYAFPNLFQLRSSGDAKLSVTQIIFSGSYIIGLKAAKTLSELSVKNSTLSKNQVVENITKAYYAVLVNQERKKVLEININRMDTLLRQTREMQKQGFVENIDVQRLEVAYNNLVNEKTKFDQIIELTKLVLKYQMGYNIATQLQITGDIRQATTNSIITKNTIDTISYLKRPEYDLLRTQYLLEGLNLKNKQMTLVPTLAAFGNYGINRSSSTIGDLFDKRAAPIILEGNDVTATWFSYNNWGLSLNVPIFSGFTTRYKIQQSKLNMKKIQNNIENFKETSIFQSQQAQININNGIISMESNKKNVDLANEIARVSKIKYQEGVGSNLEVVTAESSLKEAQSNYYNSVYDLIIADIDYKVATGNLIQK